jgi:hypothetical protein
VLVVVAFVKVRVFIRKIKFDEDERGGIERERKVERGVGE